MVQNEFDLVGPPVGDPHLLRGNFRSSGSISAEGRHALGPFWEYLAFVANSLIFLLIGAQEAQQHFEGLWAPVFAAIVLVTLGRAVAICPLCALFARSRLKVDLRYQHVLFWGGLRGALALALALSLPDDLPHQNAIVAITFAVVAFPYSRKDSPSPRSCANWARSVGLRKVRWGNGVAKAEKLANQYAFGANSVVDGENPMAPFIQGPDGNFYGTTVAGGSYG